MRSLARKPDSLLRLPFLDFKVLLVVACAFLAFFPTSYSAEIVGQTAWLWLFGGGNSDPVSSDENSEEAGAPKSKIAETQPFRCTRLKRIGFPRIQHSKRLGTQKKLELRLGRAEFSLNGVSFEHSLRNGTGSPLLC